MKTINSLTPDQMNHKQETQMIGQTRHVKEADHIRIYFPFGVKAIKVRSGGERQAFMFGIEFVDRATGQSYLIGGQNKGEWQSFDVADGDYITKAEAYYSEPFSKYHNYKVGITGTSFGTRNGNHASMGTNHEGGTTTSSKGPLPDVNGIGPMELVGVEAETSEWGLVFMLSYVFAPVDRKVRVNIWTNQLYYSEGGMSVINSVKIKKGRTSTVSTSMKKVHSTTVKKSIEASAKFGEIEGGAKLSKEESNLVSNAVDTASVEEEEREVTESVEFRKGLLYQVVVDEEYLGERMQSFGPLCNVVPDEGCELDLNALRSAKISYTLDTVTPQVKL